jgi:flagellar basal-body rod modification protein FlgD
LIYVSDKGKIMEIASQTATVSNQAARVAAQAESARGVISSDFDTFLKMLTAQIQNQDPLNPTPSDQFAVQLATFSGVEQQVRTNELLAGLTAQMGAGGLAQIAGWVGMEARAAAPAWFDGTSLTLFPTPASGADRVELVIRNQAGREVSRLSLPPSLEPFVWGGIGPNGTGFLPGNYSFELISFSQGVPTDSSTPEVYGRVREIRIEAGQPMLLFESGALVAAAEVSALREPRGS